MANAINIYLYLVTHFCKGEKWLKLVFKGIVNYKTIHIAQMFKQKIHIWGKLTTKHAVLLITSIALFKYTFKNRTQYMNTCM